MADMSCRTGAVPDGVIARMVRRAVLHKFYKFTSLAAVPGQLKRLQKLWRVAFERLCDEGADLITNYEPENRRYAKRAQYIRNCLPAMIQVAVPRPRPCRLTGTCPFCYAREVAQHLYRIYRRWPFPEKAAYGFSAGTMVLPADFTHEYVLIEFANAHTVPYLPPEAAWLQHVHHVRHLQREAISSQARWIAARKPLGAIAVARVQPWAEGWRVEHRILLLSESGIDRLAYGPNQDARRLRFILTPGRERLRSALVRTLGYPKWRLRNNGPDGHGRTAVAIAGSKGLPLTRTYGVFRPGACPDLPGDLHG